MENVSSSNSHEGLVPKLRFPEFNDNWTKVKLSDYAIFMQGLTYHPEDVVPDGDLVLRSSNIQNSQITLNDNVYVNPKIIPERIRTRELDVLMCVRNGSRNLVGKSAIIDKVSTNLSWGAFMTVLRPKYNNSLLYYYVNSPYFKQQVAADLDTATVKQITMQSLNSVVLYLPDIIEQQKLAAFLSLLDERISKHRELIEHLKSYKRGALKVMFPQNGENVPRVRFKGFTGAWEQRKFSDFTYSAGEKNKNDLPLVPYAITNEHGFIAQSEAHDDFGYMQDVDRTMYIIVKPNSFAYNPARINVGSLGYYEGEENVIVSSLYEVFQTIDDVDDKFLSHWFKTKDFMDWISRLQEGSVRQYFYYDKLCECQMSIPSLDEQHKIGAYFDNLDNLITLHQRKVDESERLKQVLINQLLI